MDNWSKIRNFIVVCLTLGCVTTLFVAWGIVLKSDLNKSIVATSIDAKSIFRDRISIEHLNTEITYEVNNIYEATGYERIFASMSEGQEEDDIKTSYVFIYKEGWPLLCITGEHHFGDHFKREGLRFAFLTSKDIFKKEAMLVWKPIPLPFVINSTIYGSVYWLLICLPILLIKHFRRSKGCCLKCGYDLRFSTVKGCPECGWLRDKDTEVSGQ